jgi:hypothetical protein
VSCWACCLIVFSVSARALANSAVLRGISVCERAREVCLRAKGRVAVLRLARLKLQFCPGIYTRAAISALDGLRCRGVLAIVRARVSDVAPYRC